MKTTKDIRIAVLIEADNVPSAEVRGMLEEIAEIWSTNTTKQEIGKLTT